MRTDRYDVVIAGSGLAGSAAAIEFGRAGLRVALLERSPSLDHYKLTCTHELQASIQGVIDRLGVKEDLDRLGTPSNKMELFTPYGWVRSELDGGYPHPTINRNVRRQVLDPLLRRCAAEVPGVDLYLGHSVDAVVKERGKVVGVGASTPEGDWRELRAQLVVGAEGRDSQVARSAGLAERRKPHMRFGFWGYFEDVELASAPDFQVFFMDPDCAYVMPTDSGLTLVCMVPHKDRLPEFKRDREGMFWRFVESLPRGPVVDPSRRVGDFVGRMDMTSIRRAVAGRGVALAGDAAIATDPVWGWGCGWALESAVMLVDATSKALLEGRGLTRALGRYRLQHARKFALRHMVVADYATGRRFNAGEKLLYASATHNDLIAQHLHAYSTGSISVLQSVAPPMMLRAAHTYLSAHRAGGARSIEELRPGRAGV